MYLELEDKFGHKPRPQPKTQPQPSTTAPPQNNNSMTRKAPGPKMSEQKMRITRVPAKSRYKLREIAQPIPTIPMPTTPVNLIPTVPIPTVATTSIQMPVVKSAATSILVIVYNLATRKFAEVPYPTGRPQNEGNSDRQRDQSKIHHPQNTQHLQSFDVPDRYSEQIRLRKEWNKKMECLNEKYGLDF